MKSVQSLIALFLIIQQNELENFLDTQITESLKLRSPKKIWVTTPKYLIWCDVTINRYNKVAMWKNNSLPHSLLIHVRLTWNSYINIKISSANTTTMLWKSPGTATLELVEMGIYFLVHNRLLSSVTHTNNSHISIYLTKQIWKKSLEINTNEISIPKTP